jgi:hypothetical protein
VSALRNAGLIFFVRQLILLLGQSLKCLQVGISTVGVP